MLVSTATSRFVRLLRYEPTLFIDLPTCFSTTAPSVIARAHRLAQFSLFCSESKKRSLFEDERVNELFFERLHRVQQNPQAARVANLIWFLVSEGVEVNRNPVFSELCDLAATLSRSFSPSEIELIFRVCIEKMEIPHVALLQNVAESLLESGDLSSFPSEMLVLVIEYISKRHRKEVEKTGHPINAVTLFPRQMEFVMFVLEDLTLEERLQRMSVKEILSAFCTAALYDINDSTIVDKLKKKIMEIRRLSREIPAKSIALVAYAVARCQRPDRNIVERMACLYFKKLKEHGEGEYLGWVLYSVFKAGASLEASKIIEACDRLLPKHLARLRNEDLACFFYSLGKLSIRNSHAFKLLSMETQKKERLKTMQGQQFLSILQAIMELNYTEDKSLVVALSREVLLGKDHETGNDHISQISVVQLCGILHIWSHLGLLQQWTMKILLRELNKDSRKADLTPTAVAVVLHAIGLSKIDDQHTMTYLESEWIVPRQLAKFDEQLLTMAICGLAQFHRPLVIRMFNRLIEEIVIRRDLSRFTTKQLANIINAMSLVRYAVSSAAMETLMETITSESRMKSMNGQDLSETIYAIARHISRDMALKTSKRRFAILLIDEAVQPKRLKTMDNQSLSNIMLALGKIQYRNEHHVRSLAFELLQPYRSEALSQEGFIQLTHTVVALSKLDIRDCHLILDTISNVLLKNGARTIPPIGICFLVMHMATLRYKNVQVYDMLVKEALRKDRAGQLLEQHLPQMVEAIGSLGFSRLFSELMMHGLQNLQNTQRFNLVDLKRIQAGLHSLNSVVWQSVADRLEKTISKRTRLRRTEGNTEPQPHLS